MIVGQAVVAGKADQAARATENRASLSARNHRRKSMEID
jgi:hypothetical protein